MVSGAECNTGATKMFSSVSVYRGNSVNTQPSIVQPSGDDGPVQCFDICDLESLQPLQESSSPPLVFVGDALSSQPEVARPSGGGVLVQLPICDGAAELHKAVTKRPEDVWRILLAVVMILDQRQWNIQTVKR